MILYDRHRWRRSIHGKPDIDKQVIFKDGTVLVPVRSGIDSGIVRERDKKAAVENVKSQAEMLSPFCHKGKIYIHHKLLRTIGIEDVINTIALHLDESMINHGKLCIMATQASLYDGEYNIRTRSVRADRDIFARRSYGIDRNKYYVAGLIYTKSLRQLPAYPEKIGYRIQNGVIKLNW